MKLFRFFPRSNDFGYIDPAGDWSRFEECKPIKTWKPITVKYIAHGKKPGDFPDLFLNIPVFSESACESLQSLVKEDVQALKIETKVGPFYVINVLAMDDCLDKHKSDFVYYRNGMIMRVNSYVFKKGAGRKHHIFKIPETMRREVVVTEEFANAVKEHKLVGVRFELLGQT